MQMRARAVIVVLAVALIGAPVAVAAPGDIVFERKDAPEGMENYPPAIFPHWLHRIRYRCDACHPKPFAMKKGAAQVTMETIIKGEACGQCHDGGEAFNVEFQNCTRCHANEEKK